MKFSRLSHQILLVFVAVVVAALGVSGWAITTLAQRIVADNVQQGHQKLTRRIAEEIDLEMEDIQPLLSQLAETIGVLSLDPVATAAELARYQAHFPAISEAYVADLSGQQIARTDGQSLENAATTYGFQVAREGYELISDVYLPQDGSGPMLTVYLPILDEGQVSGVLVADVDFARVQTTLEGLELTRNETAVVFAPNGRIVAHSQMAELAELPALTDPALIETLVRGPAGVLEGYLDELGRTVVGVHAPAHELGWGVVIQTPVGEMTSEVAMLRRMMIGGVLIGAALAVIAGWWMARRLAQPIGQLAQTADQIAAGDLGARSGLPYGQGELGQLAHAFDEMAGALQGQRAETERAAEALQHYAMRLEVMHEIDRAILAHRSPQAIAQAALAPIRRLVPCTRASVAEFDFEADKGTVLAAHADGETRMQAGARLSLERFGIAGGLRRGEIQVVDDILAQSQPSPIEQALLAEGVRSSISVPLLAQGELIGSLNMGAREPGAFGAEQTEILEEVANPLAIAIQQARLHEQVQRHAAELEQRVDLATEEIRRRADELAALYKVSRDLVATLDLEVLLPVIVRRVTETLQADRCAIFLFDERAGVLRARAAHGYRAERLADFSYRPGEEVVGQAYATGEPQYVPDLEQSSDLPRRDEIRAVLAIPLVSPTAGALGALSVTSRQARAFSPDQQQLLETMASQITGAIESARLFKQSQAWAEELAVLNQVGKEITATLELDTMLQMIAQDTVRLVEADKSLILLIDPEKEKLVKVVGHGYSQAQLDEHTFEEFQDGLSGWVLREKVPTLTADIQGDERNRGKALASARASQDRSATVAPLLIGQEMLGTLTAINRQGNRAFTPADLSLVTMLAGQAAIAIQNARLYEAAQEADRLKSAFLASMSHELRTPLNSIIGFTGILLQGLVGPLNDEQSKQLGMVMNSARHLLNLINDVLDISKIEAGQLEIASEPFDMGNAIEQAVQTVTPLADKKGVRLVVSVAPEVGRITGDRRRVEQILINLVNNAIKFTAEGEVRVESQVDDGWLVTRVVDTGIGIRAEDVAHLFKPFRQIDTGVGRRHEGTGLGLSISKRLVELMGGEIWVESEWGVGSTFTFTLPRPQ